MPNLVPATDFTTATGLLSGATLHNAIALATFASSSGALDGVTIESSGGKAQIKDVGVSTAKLALLAVTPAQLAADAVETAKIKDAAVTTAKILDANVTADKILDGAVTLAKVPDNTLTPAKMVQTPAFKIALTADQTLLKDAYTEIDFDREIFDNGGNFAANGYTVPAGYAGIHNFHVQMALTSSVGAGEIIWVGIYVDDVIVKFGNTTDDEKVVLVTALLNLAEGEKVTAKAIQNSSSTKYIDAIFTATPTDFDVTTFEGYFVGR